MRQKSRAPGPMSAALVFVPHVGGRADVELLLRISPRALPGRPLLLLHCSCADGIRVPSQCEDVARIGGTGGNGGAATGTVSIGGNAREGVIIEGRSCQARAASRRRSVSRSVRGRELWVIGTWREGELHPSGHDVAHFDRWKQPQHTTA